MYKCKYSLGKKEQAGKEGIILDSDRENAVRLGPYTTVASSKCNLYNTEASGLWTGTGTTLCYVLWIMV